MPERARRRGRIKLEAGFVLAFVAATGNLLCRWEKDDVKLGGEALRSAHESFSSHTTRQRASDGLLVKQLGANLQRPVRPLSRREDWRHPAPQAKDSEGVKEPKDTKKASKDEPRLQEISTISSVTAVNETAQAKSIFKPKIVGRTIARKNKQLGTTFSNTTQDMNPMWIEPHYFRDQVPLELLIRRGNVLTAHTGCAIATWSYQGVRHKYRPLNDCRQHAKSAEALRAHQVTPETAYMVQPNDAIYVPIVQLEHFVNTTLPNITNDIVLISGQMSKPPDLIPSHVFDSIIQHPRIIKWFLQNLSVYAAGAVDHDKLRSFPYGVHPKQSPLLLNEMKVARNRTRNIYISHMNKGTNIKFRRNIPNGEQVNASEYLRRLHESNYVLSPNGDRPECHRTYEAIAMGTMPITSLDKPNYRHFERNIIYNVFDWNVTLLERRLPRVKPRVNQRLVFEEYWMEYVEREVGLSLRWWDPSRNVRSSLQDIQNDVKASTR